MSLRNLDLTFESQVYVLVQSRCLNSINKYKKLLDLDESVLIEENNEIYQFEFRREKMYDNETLLNIAEISDKIYVTEYHYDGIYHIHNHEIIELTQANISSLANLLFHSGVLSIKEAISEVLRKTIFIYENVYELLLIESEPLFVSIVDYLELEYCKIRRQLKYGDRLYDILKDIIIDILDKFILSKDLIIPLSSLPFNIFLALLNNQ